MCFPPWLRYPLELIHSFPLLSVPILQRTTPTATAADRPVQTQISPFSYSQYSLWDLHKQTTPLLNRDIISAPPSLRRTIPLTLLQNQNSPRTYQGLVHPVSLPSTPTCFYLMSSLPPFLVLGQKPVHSYPANHRTRVHHHLLPQQTSL